MIEHVHCRGAVGDLSGQHATHIDRGNFVGTQEIREYVQIRGTEIDARTIQDDDRGKLLPTGEPEESLEHEEQYTPDLGGLVE